jgi:diguanylate cyclase (GGDEF)-like protein/PAS domain S-box-containing protein
MQAPTNIGDLDLEHYREAVEQAGHSIYVTNREGTILYVNPAFEETTGYSADEALGSKPNLLKSDQHDESFYENLWNTILNGTVWRGEVINEKKDGTHYVVDQTIAPIMDESENQPKAFVAVNHDITDRKQYEEALEEHEQTLQLALEAADAGSWTWDPETNEQQWDETIYKLCGIRPDGEPDLLSVVHPEDREDVKQKAQLYSRKVQQCLDPGEYSQEFRILQDGEVRCLETRGRYYHPQNQSRGYVVGITIDITDQKRMRQTLRDQALYDNLTGLPNRNLLEDRLDMAVRRCQRTGDWPFALVFLDLDQFKEINDIYGHSFGDELLVQVGERLQDCIRDEDTAARMGGDEFVILYEDVDSPDRAERALKRLRDELHDPIVIDNQKITVTYSFGMDLATPEHHRPEDLLQNADAAMYRAKKDPTKNQYFLAEPSLNTDSKGPDLRDELVRAIEEDELTVHYQPVVDPAHDRIVALEALARWEHPRQGTLRPDDFFPTIKEAGKLPDLDRTVFDQVLSDLEGGHFEGNSRSFDWVSVNFSPQFFLKEGALGQILRSLDESELPTDALRLELTEKTATKKKEFTRDNLSELRANNLRLGIDDFGTGYFSLRNLQQLPVDYLKTDRSLLPRVDSNFPTHSTELLENAVDVTRLLEIKSTVKGVETQEHRDLVNDLEPDYAQGRWFGEAQPLNELPI